MYVSKCLQGGVTFYIPWPTDYTSCIYILIKFNMNLEYPTNLIVPISLGHSRFELSNSDVLTSRHFGEMSKISNKKI